MFVCIKCKIPFSNHAINLLPNRLSSKKYPLHKVHLKDRLALIVFLARFEFIIKSQMECTFDVDPLYSCHIDDSCRPSTWFEERRI